MRSARPFGSDVCQFLCGRVWPSLGPGRRCHTHRPLVLFMCAKWTFSEAPPVPRIDPRYTNTERELRAANGRRIERAAAGQRAEHVQLTRLRRVRRTRHRRAAGLATGASAGSRGPAARAHTASRPGAAVLPATRPGAVGQPPDKRQSYRPVRGQGKFYSALVVRGC